MPIVFVKEVSFSKQTHIINKITIQTCLHISKNDVRLHCIGHFADCIYVLLTCTTYVRYSTIAIVII